MASRSNTKRLIATATGAVVVGIAIVGGAGASAFNDPDEGPDRAIVGDALVTASEVALEHTGGGTVTETEIEDEES